MKMLRESWEQRGRSLESAGSRGLYDDDGVKTRQPLCAVMHPCAYRGKLLTSITPQFCFGSVGQREPIWQKGSRLQVNYFSPVWNNVRTQSIFTAGINESLILIFNICSNFKAVALGPI